MAGAFQRNAFQNNAFQVGAATQFTANAVLRRNQTATFTVDAIFAGRLTINAVLKRNQTGSFAADAVLVKGFTANAVLKRGQTGSFAANAILRITRTGSFTADAEIVIGPAARATQAAVSALVVPDTRTARATQAAVSALVVPDTRTARATQAAAGVLAIPFPQIAQVTQVAVVVLINRAILPFTADAVLRRTQVGSFTADAVIHTPPIVGSFTANAIKRTTTIGFIDVWAVIAKTPPSGSFTADARIERNFKADAVLRKAATGSFTANAWIFAPAGSVHPTPKVSIIVDGIDITADVVFKDSTFTMLVNGAIGSCKVKVKDRPRTRNFTSGAEITLDIDGIRKFGGYVTQPSRMFAFDVEDTSHLSRITRFWILTGVDYNILFAKRIVYDKVDPANVNLRSWPAGSRDDDVIRYVFDHYTDLAADGATYLGVTHIGSPNPDRQGVIASGSLTFGQAMQEINRLISGVWYFDPYKDLTFVDVDIPNSIRGLSDLPIIGVESGYREFEHIENGSNLVNDALIWGAAAGVDTIAFARVQSFPSQAEHGLWQYGEFTSQLYKQASVNQRADSIVNGTPQSKRGGKDDQVSWAVTTWDTAFSVGQKVQIESEVWGVSDVVPIRRMTITFPTKNHPKYQLLLSHEIDQPWNMFEFFFPRIGGFEIIPPTKPGPFNVLNQHFWFGTFTYTQGTPAGAGGDNAGNGTTIYTDNTDSMFLEFGKTYTFALGMIVPPDAYFWDTGFIGGGDWRGVHFRYPVLGQGGTFTVPGDVTVLVLSEIASARDVPETVNITWWVDPPGWDVGSPIPGQQVINDFSAVGTGSTTTYFTTFPYRPGSLVVTVSGVEVAVTETNPATGEFTLAVAPPIGAQIICSYIAAGTAPPSFNHGGVREDLLGTGSTLIQLASAYVTGSTRVFLNGFFQRPGFEYTESSPSTGQITFTVAPTTLQIVSVFYEANGPT